MEKKEQQKQGIFQKVFSNTKNIIGEFFEDECLNLSAGIAYYALQSLIPLILGFIAIGSFFLRDGQVRQNFEIGLQSAIPASVSNVIDLNKLIDQLAEGASVAGLISVIILLWTGSGIFDQLIYATNKAFDVEKDERNFFFKLALRMLFLVGLGGLLLLAFGTSFITRLIFDAKIAIFGISPSNFSFILPIISYALPILLQIIILALLYRFGPARKDLKWKPILIGAVIGGLLLELLKAGFSLYVSVFGGAEGAAKTYGTLGGIIVFLLFIYLVAAVMLIGAEVAATLLGIESGLTAVKIPDAIVENKSKQVGESLMPSTFPASGQEQPQAASEKAGVGQSEVMVNNAAPTSKLKVVIGAVFFFVITFGSLLFQRKRPSNL